MSIDEFWEIVDRVNDNASGMEAKCELLGEELRRLSAPEVKAFHIHFLNRLYPAISWKFWQAAQIIYGDQCEKEFTGFLTTIISKGKTVYENAIASPDTLASFDLENLGLFNVMYAGIAKHVYEEKTLVWPDESMAHKPDAPSGTEISSEDLPATFPRLLAKYANRPNDGGDAGAPDTAAAIRSSCQKTWGNLENMGVNTETKLIFSFSFKAATQESAKTLKAWLMDRRQFDAQIEEIDIPGCRRWRVWGTMETKIPSLAKLMELVEWMVDAANENACEPTRWMVEVAGETGEDEAMI